MPTRAIMAGCVVLLPALVLSQSLGDAARKEQERRQKLAAQGVKARAVTSDDLASGSGGSVSPAPSPKPSPSADGKAPAATTEAANTGGDEARTRRQSEDGWRRRMAQARARLERATKRHDTLAGMSLSPGEYYVDAENRPLITSVEQLQRLTAEAKAEQAAAQQALEDIEEEARRANVPPGWLR
jgi:hypothetical protein